MDLFVLFLFAYLLGNLLTGSFISKLFYRKDILTEGSGNPGARNAGRLYGKWAFVCTFIGDAAKGMVVVFLANWFEFGTTVELLALLAVVLGHMYPVLSKFRGGKGVSTWLGGLLAFNPVLILLIIAVFLIFYPFNKSVTTTGMIAVLFVPVGVSISYGWVPFFIASLLSLLILFAHRENLKKKRVE